MTATLRQVRAAAAKLGATVDYDTTGDSNVVSVEAPRRQKWRCRDIHEMVDSAYKPWKPDYDDVLRCMALGLTPCEEPDCEWCGEG